MRDILTDFGIITTATADTSVAFPNGIDAGQGGNLGRINDLYVVAQIDAKTVPASDLITIDIYHGDAVSGETVVQSYSAPVRAYAIGDTFSFKLPADHKQYLSAKGKVKTTTGVKIHLWLEVGEPA